jgi:hypothetical protein
MVRGPTLPTCVNSSSRVSDAMERGRVIWQQRHHRWYTSLRESSVTTIDDIINIINSYYGTYYTNINCYCN